MLGLVTRNKLQISYDNTINKRLYFLLTPLLFQGFKCHQSSIKGIHTDIIIIYIKTGSIQKLIL